MPERKKWTTQEDNLLITLKNQENELNWSNIAAKMKKTFFQFEKNGKQCRERFHSHLEKKNVIKEWTQTDRQKLFELHNKFGNKWMKIADQMGNRTDNCVKNYFYSSMKKSIRRLSLIIRLSHLKNVKSLKLTDICIILDAFDAKFRHKITNWSQQDIRISQEIKNAMFHMSNMDLEHSIIQITSELLELVQKITQFLKKGRKRIIKKHNIKKNIDKSYCPQLKYKQSQANFKPTILKEQRQQNNQDYQLHSKNIERQSLQKSTNIIKSIDSQITNDFNFQIIKEPQLNNKKITKQFENFSNELVELNYPTFKMENQKIQSYFNVDCQQQKFQSQNLFSIEQSQLWEPLSLRSFKSFKSYSSLDKILFD